MSDLVDNLDKVVAAMLQTTTRHEAINVLKIHFQDRMGDGNPSKIHWLAQQVVADIDEVFVDVFKEPVTKEIVGGYGAHAGHVLMKNAEESMTFVEALERIVKDLQAAPTPHLNILGLVRLECGKVVHKLNGRPVNGSDGEVCPCKIYSAAKVTYGAYSTSPYPFFSKPHCHPVRLHSSDVTHAALEIRVKEIMQSVVEAMRACTSTAAEDNIRLSIPEFCLRLGERDWREQNLLQTDCE